MLYEFDKNDKQINILEINPEVTFEFISNTNTDSFFNKNSYNALNLDNSNTNLLEINVDRVENQKIYPFVNRNTYNNFLDFGTDNYNNTPIGNIITGSYNQSTGFSIYLIDDTEKYKYYSILNICKSLKLETQVLNLKNGILSSNYDSFFTAFMIDREIFGTSIQKKSTHISIDFNFENETTEMDLADGFYTIEAFDLYGDGKLYAKSNTMYSNFPSSKEYFAIGEIIYTYGIILFYDNSLRLGDNGNFPNEDDQPYTWRKFGKLLKTSGSVKREIKFSVKFNSTNRIPNINMFCKVKRNELNHSNNPTSLEPDQNIDEKMLTAFTFFENHLLQIKNMSNDSLLMQTHSGYLGNKNDLQDIEVSKFEKSTFISEINIYDEDKELIAIARLANPKQKKENEEFIFKLKVDM
jgi:hypothetical protein